MCGRRWGLSGRRRPWAWAWSTDEGAQTCILFWTPFTLLISVSWSTRTWTSVLSCAPWWTNTSETMSQAPSKLHHVIWPQGHRSNQCSHYDQIHQRNNLMEGELTLSHGLRGFTLMREPGHTNHGCQEARGSVSSLFLLLSQFIK